MCVAPKFHSVKSATDCFTDANQMTIARLLGAVISCNIDSMTSDVSMYRVYQCVEDLRALVLRGGPAPLVRIARQGPGVNASAFLLAQILDEIVRTDMRIPGQHARDVEACLLLATLHPQKDPIGFETASALLLADRVRQGSGVGDLEDVWQRSSSFVLSAEAPVRAALVQGFDLACDLGFVDLPQPFTVQAKQTRDAGDVSRSLLDAAQALAHAELSEMVRAGVESEMLRHMQHLLENLTRLGGAEQLSQDVVNISSTEQERPDYLPRLALACWKAQSDAAVATAMARHWAESADMILSHPYPATASILSGFRRLFETQPDWDPYADMSQDDRLASQTAIPWWLDPA